MNWDDEDYEAPQIDSDLKANWDDEDEEEDEPAEEPVKAPAAPTTTSIAKKKKKELEAKIKEKEEKEAKAQAARAEREQNLDGLSEVERKLRQQKMVEESDFENAKDMFMDGDGADVQLDDDSIDKMMPKTEAEFKRFHELLSKKLVGIQESTTRLYFMNFMKELLRSITNEMSVDDVKDLGSHINVISNEKLQASKGTAAKKTKGKKKAPVKIERSQVLDAYTDDNYDDFM